MGRYAPHIFDDPRQKLKKFVSGLRSNVRHFMVSNDLETFAKAVRVACIIEEEHGRFLEEQKRAGKHRAQ